MRTRQHGVWARLAAAYVGLALPGCALDVSPAVAPAARPASMAGMSQAVVPPAAPPRAEPAPAPEGMVGGVLGPALAPPAPSPGGVIPLVKGMEAPVLLAGRQPSYTAEAREAGIQGKLIARCTITLEGLLIDCRVIKSLPLLDQEVLAALATHRYRPIMYQGRPQAVFYTLSFRFALPDPPPAAP